MSEQSDQAQAQAEQRQESKRATLAQLRGKRRVREIYERELNGEKASFLFQAVSNAEYDALLTACPPTTAQRAEGASYNPDKFAPQLLAKVCIEPKLAEAEWSEIWTSPDWSRGETNELFLTAVNLCNRGQGLTPFERD